VQIQEELPVGKPPGQPVRDVHSQCGLADPGHAVDRGDGNSSRPPVHPGSKRGEPVNLAVATDEVLGRRGQLPGHRHRRRCRRSGVSVRADGLAGRRWHECWIAGQDLPVQELQLRAGLDPQLRHQGLPRLSVRLQRLGLPSGPGQRFHQLSVEPLPDRMTHREATQFGDQQVIGAQPQLRLGPVFQHLHAQLLESRHVLIAQDL
jgi:hypothetical protein